MISKLFEKVNIKAKFFKHILVIYIFSIISTIKCNSIVNYLNEKNTVNNKSSKYKDIIKLL